jgi:hypothetical protein
LSRSFGKWYWGTAHFTGVGPEDRTGAVKYAVFVTC